MGGGVAHADADDSGNTVNISEETELSGLTIGGSGSGEYGNADGNIVNVTGGNVGRVYGGQGFNARNNIVNISGGSISDVLLVNGRGNFVIIGGFATGNEVSGNTINISGGTIFGAVLSNGVLIGRVRAGVGRSDDTNITNNFINVWGNPNLTYAWLYGFSGADAANPSSHSGNTLNLATQITAYNISNFDALNFFIPASMNGGGTMLTLTNTSGVDLSGTAIRAAMQGGSNLDTGDSVTLIQSAGTITTDDTTTYGKMTQAEYDAIKDRLPSGMLSDGVSLNYEMNIEKSGDNAIVARIGNTTDDTDDNNSTSNSSNSNSTSNSSSSNSTIISDNGGGLRSQTKVISEAAVVPSIHLAGFMSDKLVDWLPPRSFDFEDESDDESLPDAPTKESKGYEVFMGAGSGSYRNKTGNGSYVESTMKGFDLGFGRSIDYSNGPLVFAPIFEYGTGKYDSYLSDGMHGRGNTKYIAGGLIGRKTFKSGFYVEASARVGKTERDFSSDTMTSNGSVVYTHYDKKSAPVFNGHLRVGRQLRLNRNNLLDMYGIYFHAHQGSMNLNLSTGEPYHFDSANASKVRLGYRLTTRTSKISRIYTGLAFQYEHTSDAVGTYKGRRTPSAGNHGASGMLEVGWLIKPNKNNPWMLDLNATGWVGHQRGVSATFKLQKSF